MNVGLFRAGVRAERQVVAIAAAVVAIIALAVGAIAVYGSSDRGRCADGTTVAGVETAPGRYEIESKVQNPPWNVPDEPWAGSLAGRVVPPGAADNPLKARWLGFHDGEGIHGTADIASLGSAASHGCIRMAVRDVKQLYRRVPLHTP